MRQNNIVLFPITHKPFCAQPSRRCVLLAISPHHLGQKKPENMQTHEEFAGYLDVTDIVVALDKQGVCVIV